MTKDELVRHRLLRLARLRGDRAAELIVEGFNRATKDRAHRAYHGISPYADFRCPDYPDITGHPVVSVWTEAELRAAWGDR